MAAYEVSAYLDDRPLTKITWAQDPTGELGKYLTARADGRFYTMAVTEEIRDFCVRVLEDLGARDIQVAEKTVQ